MNPFIPNSGLNNTTTVFLQRHLTFNIPHSVEKPFLVFFYYYYYLEYLEY